MSSDTVPNSIDFQLDPEIRLFANAILEGYSRLNASGELTVQQSRALVQDGDALDPMASQLLADLRSLPPAFIVIASPDILYDENISMAVRQTEAGVPVRAVVFPGTTHSFLEAGSIAEVNDRALSEWLRESLQ